MEDSVTRKMGTVPEKPAAGPVGGRQTRSPLSASRTARAISEAEGARLDVEEKEDPQAGQRESVPAFKLCRACLDRKTRSQQ